jgi:hypothetical protein
MNEGLGLCRFDLQVATLTGMSIEMFGLLEAGTVKMLHWAGHGDWRRCIWQAAGKQTS